MKKKDQESLRKIVIIGLVLVVGYLGYQSMTSGSSPFSEAGEFVMGDPMEETPTEEPKMEETKMEETPTEEPKMEKTPSICCKESQKTCVATDSGLILYESDIYRTRYPINESCPHNKKRGDPPKRPFSELIDAAYRTILLSWELRNIQESKLEEEKVNINLCKESKDKVCCQGLLTMAGVGEKIFGCFQGNQMLDNLNEFHIIYNLNKNYNESVSKYDCGAPLMVVNNSFCEKSNEIICCEYTNELAFQKPIIHSLETRNNCIEKEGEELQNYEGTCHDPHD